VLYNQPYQGRRPSNLLINQGAPSVPSASTSMLGYRIHQATEALSAASISDEREPMQVLE
jgi:hypothetical protein